MSTQLRAVLLAAIFALSVLAPVQSASAAATDGSVSGRVVNADGSSFDGTVWSVTAKAVADGSVYDTPVSGDGSWAISALPAGEYILFASVLAEHTGIPPAYYGGTLDADRATSVVLAPGQRLSGLDIALFTGEDAPVEVVGTSAPSISGTPRVGHTLEADPGYWYASMPDDQFQQPLAVEDFNYTWYVGRRPIRSVSTNTLTIRWWMRGQPIRVRITPAINWEQPIEFTVRAPLTSSLTARVR